MRCRGRGACGPPAPCPWQLLGRLCEAPVWLLSHSLLPAHRRVTGFHRLSCWAPPGCPSPRGHPDPGADALGLASGRFLCGRGCGLRGRGRVLRGGACVASRDGADADRIAVVRGRGVGTGVEGPSAVSSPARLLLREALALSVSEGAPSLPCWAWLRWVSPTGMRLGASSELG